MVAVPEPPEDHEDAQHESRSRRAGSGARRALSPGSVPAGTAIPNSCSMLPAVDGGSPRGNFIPQGTWSGGRSRRSPGSSPPGRARRRPRAPAPRAASSSGAAPASRQPFRITAIVPPMNPPYQTRPPREKSAPGSRVSATYQSLAPDDPADHRRRDRCPPRSPRPAGAAASSSAMSQPPMRNADHHHDAVAGDLERPEMDDERIDGHEPVRGGCREGTVRPGMGRSSRGSRSQPLRSPRARRQAPAAAIIAALSVLSRGEATLTRAVPASRVAHPLAPAPGCRPHRRRSSPSNSPGSRRRAPSSRPALPGRRPEIRGPGRRGRCSRSALARTARSTAVLRPLKEKA